METTLIFVYNADSNLFSKVTDFAHKIISPKTYSCNLCAITYDNFGMKKEWSEFIKSIDLNLKFLHKDEFLLQYKQAESEFPAIFISRAGVLELLITSDAINACHSIEDLEKLIADKLPVNK